MKDVNVLFIFFLLIMLGSCSFKSEEELVEYNPPKLVFKNMTITKFEQLNKSTVLDVEYLESYVSDEVWAGKGLRFTQYDTDKKDPTTNDFPVKLKGSFGSGLFDKKNKEFFFGDAVFFEITEEDLTISAPMLFFDQEEHILHAPLDAEVKLQKGYDLRISGKGFVANTLSKEFEFNLVEGLVSKDNKPEK